MTVKQFKNIISEFPEECELRITIENNNPYPFNYKDVKYSGYDIGYSDSIAIIYLEEEQKT